MEKNVVNVLFDHQIFSLQKVGGISRYYAGLLKNLPSNACRGVFSSIYSENIYLEKSRVLPFTSKLHPKLQGRLNELFNRANSREMLNSDVYDVFHPTYYSTYHLGKSRKPFVITVHDMIHEIYPQQFRFPNKIIKNKKELLEAADKVICVSHHTKNDILKFVSIDPSKIDVVYHATSISEVSPEILPINLTQFILFVGQRKGYKNFTSLAKAFARVKDKYPDISLFCAGGGTFNGDEMKLLADLKIQDRAFQREVTDNELAWAYRNAECFVFPSYYEGFGIPIIESMSLGTPTVLSNSSCFPEIAKSAALYFNSVDELSEILDTLISSSKEKEVLKLKGLKLSKEFSWDRVAKETSDIYRKLV